jgi:[protein-PII] uridylyltransferase
VVPSPVSLRVARTELLEHPAIQGLDFCERYSAAADAQLSQLVTDASGGDLKGLALLAVGGYGRSELCPHSDLDVVLIHRQRRDISTVADSIWYPVWDEGVHLDYAVRTPAEALAMASKDLRVQLGLLDGRIVAGDPDVGEPVLARAREVWRTLAPQWLPVLANQVALRHHQHGDVAFLLEPDLKEAHGGLRDLSGLHAAVLAAPALGRDNDLATLDPARSVLLNVRVELHRRSTRASDTLLLQDQDAIAAALEYDDADALMSEVARAGRAIAWVGDDIWSRNALWQVTRKRRRWLVGSSNSNDQGDPAPTDADTEIHEVETGVAIATGSGGRAHGEVVLTPGGDPALDATLGLRIAAVASERDLAIARSTLDELGRLMPSPAEPWPAEVRGAFVRVLSAGEPAVRSLEALDHYELLSRFVPEWDDVRNRPQRNAYHRFTVDRHLLEAAAQAARLMVRVARSDLLLVGAFLHDIGKGAPGDHTDAGVVIVDRIATRMGFSPDDVRTLVTLVRNHLLLAELATRRDLDDPATIEAVTRAVGDRQTLDLLAALTEADSLATGPAAWGTWKAGLVADLVQRAGLALAGDELPPPTVALLSAEHRTLMARLREEGPTADAAVIPDGSRVTVVARDHPGLLASVTGVLCLHDLDLRSADIAGEDDVALEVFTVEPAHGRWPDWDKVASDLNGVLDGKVDLAGALAKRDATYERTGNPLVPVGVRVTIDNLASSTSTVVEVRAPDEASLLHRVTAALFASDLDVVAARACTLGDEVVDAFYVRDRLTPGRIEEPSRLRELASSLETLLDRSKSGDETD